MNVIKHAIDNWEERTDNTISIHTAWNKAHPIGYVRSFFHKPEHEPCDEIRMYHGVTEDGEEYTMLILARGNDIITTFPYTGVSDHLVDSYLDELEDATIYYE